MKTDRLVKVMLAITVLLLMLNYVTSFSTTSALAPPPFLQKGPLYKMDGKNPVKVIEIDESGWVKVQEVDATGRAVSSAFGSTSYWINTNAVRSIESYSAAQ